MLLKFFLRFSSLSILKMFARLAARTIITSPEKGMYKKVSVNISIAYPHLSASEQQTISHKIITNQCITAAESMKVWSMPPKWSIAQIKQVHNEHLIQTAFKQPNGVLLVLPHIGTWEMMNAWLHQFGTPTIMYKPIKHKKFNQFILNSRQSLSGILVPTNQQGVKAIFKTLKQGGYSIILPDHVPHPSGGVYAPFFGKNTLTSSLTPKMAARTQCKMVGVSCIRRVDTQGYDIYCYDLNHEDLYDKEPEIAAKALNHELEKMINQFPEHYMWGYKRFRLNADQSDPYH